MDIAQDAATQLAEDAINKVTAAVSDRIANIDGEDIHRMEVALTRMVEDLVETSHNPNHPDHPENMDTAGASATRNLKVRTLGPAKRKFGPTRRITPTPVERDTLPPFDAPDHFSHVACLKQASVLMCPMCGLFKIVSIN